MYTSIYYFFCLGKFFDAFLCRNFDWYTDGVHPKEILPLGKGMAQLLLSMPVRVDPGLLD